VYAAPSAPAPGGHPAPAASQPVTAGAPTQGASGYARRPSPAPKGIAALARRPGPWIALLLVVAFVAAFPLGIFRLPRIRLAPHAVEERDTDAQRAAAHSPAESGRETQSSRPRKSAAKSTAPSPPPKATASDEDSDTPPDASILFDLPALEPEDGDPDPVVTPPNRLAPSAGRDAQAPAKDADGAASERDSDSPMICGEVRGPQGTPIEGARVYLASPARMVRTDRQGHFCVVCPPGARTVRIEASGRASVTRTLEVGNERLETRFTLDVAN
jgi:carboxypeptidase family protein